MIDDLLRILQARGVEFSVAYGSISYRAPKGAISEVDLLLLKKHRRDLYDVLTRRDVRQSLCKGTPERPNFIPLSFQQERIWSVDRLGLTGSAYNVGLAFLLRGVLSAAALEHAHREVLKRHEGLRTRFVELDKRPQQVVDPIEKFGLSKVDLSDIDIAEWPTRKREIAQSELDREFSLSEGRLLRATLVGGPRGEWLLLIVMHHIITDGWSTALLLQELSFYYNSFVSGQSADLPPPEIQYPDYAIWQRTANRQPHLNLQLDYWRSRLSGAKEVELPTDRPRKRIPSYRGAWISAPLSGELSRAIRGLARDQDATPFMILLAAFQVLLGRWSGQTDVLVGSPVAGRIEKSLESTMGFFVNTLALRTDLSDDPPYKALVRRVRETTISAYEQQEVPFERLVAELRPNADLSRQPLVPVKFAMQNFPTPTLQLNGLEVSEFKDREHKSAKFDLNLYVTEERSAFTCGFELATDLFDVETIARFVTEFELLLQQIAVNPERRISRLAAHARVSAARS